MTGLFGVASRSIPLPDGIKELKYKSGNTSDIIKVILEADKFIQGDTKEFSKYFTGSRRFEKLWSFVKRHIKYVADEPGHEKIKSPAQTWFDGYGDCKSMSLFVASVLKNLQIPYAYRFVSYSKNKNISHVYVVAMPKGANEIIIDTVHTKYNEEVPYSYKKDYKMTRISYIHGTPNSSTSSRSSVSFPEKLVKAKHIDWSGMSEGEMHLHLLDEQLKIASSYYGDPIGVYQQGRNMIFQALKGLHTTTGVSSFGRVPKAIQHIAAGIINSKKNYKHASKYLKNVTSINGPRDFIPNVNCESSEFGTSILNDSYNEDLDRPEDKFIFTIHPGKQDAYYECLSRQRFIPLMNMHYEKAAPHLLYNFIGNANLVPSIVSTKSVLHKSGISVMNKITGVSKNNLSLWTFNGIMRSNANAGTDPWNPLQTIDILKRGGNHPDAAKIGEPISLTLIALAKVITVLIAAIGATATLVNSFKKSPNGQLFDQVQGITTGAFSADSLDWKTGQNVGFNKAGLSKIVPFIVLSAAGYYLLNGKAMKL